VDRRDLETSVIPTRCSSLKAPDKKKLLKERITWGQKRRWKRNGLYEKNWG